MARAFALLSLVVTLSLTSGCATCCNPFDCFYLYQGGAWVRNDPEHGRVGSAFTPEVGSKVLPDEVVTAESQPTPAGRTGLSASGARPTRASAPAGDNYSPSN
jgi:hypothetical protein